MTSDLLAHHFNVATFWGSTIMAVFAIPLFIWATITNWSINAWPGRVWFIVFTIIWCVNLYLGAHGLITGREINGAPL